MQFEEKAITMSKNESKAMQVLAKIYCGDNPLSNKAEQELLGFENRAKRTRTSDEHDSFIEIHKEFSSYTPIMDSGGRKVSGGGYFLVIGGYGCVIDPGHHFLANFYKHGRTTDDIDAVFVTHFHDDHYADLPAILSLLYRRGKVNKERLVDIFLDHVTYEMFKPMLESADHVGQFRKLSAAKRFNDPRNGFSCECLPTRHDVFGRDDTGCGLHYYLKSKNTHLIITGDTAWTDKIEKCYKEKFYNLKSKKILVAHVSTVYGGEGAMVGADSDCEPSRHPNHLALYGLCRCIEVTRPDTVMLSEIGEELEGVIAKMAKIVADTYEIKVSVAHLGATEVF